MFGYTMLLSGGGVAVFGGLGLGLGAFRRRLSTAKTSKISIIFPITGIYLTFMDKYTMD